MARKILEPIRIKSMKLKNRIGFGPMLNQPYGPNGEVTDDTINWYLARAKGDVGFAMSGTINPSLSTYEEFQKAPPVGGLELALCLHDDSYIPGYRKLTDAVHEYDMMIGAQLGAGGLTKNASPSPYTHDNIMNVLMDIDLPVEEWTIEEMEEIKTGCAETARRAKDAGFDCVELHTAHGYVSVWGGFMSPFTNRRTDKYGGNWENRLRYPLETITAMRKAVGEDYPILVRLSADELMGSEGVTLEDTLQYIIPAMEGAGVDCFDISMGSMLHNPNNIPSIYVARGNFIYLAAAVKKVARVPVIGVGRIADMSMAEKFIEEGKADIIYLGRQLIADPETPKKYFEGRTEDIRKCIYDAPGFGGCCEICTVNPTPPAMGSSDDVVLTDKPKNVLIIGGGVAGMETARVAALRGHKVTLIEKDAELGGIVKTLSLNPLNIEFGNLVDFLSNQMKKLGVYVRVCREVTSTEIKEFGADAVVLATGSTMTIPKAVHNGLNVMSHLEALKNKAGVGQNVIIQGLGYGSELAIALAEEGKNVIIFGKGKEIATNIVPLRRTYILKRLTDVDLVKGDGDIPVRNENSPTVMTGMKLVEINPVKVILENKKGETTTIPYDTFIVSLGRRCNDALYKELKAEIKEIYQIGDAEQAGEINDAMDGAYKVGIKI